MNEFLKEIEAIKAGAKTLLELFDGTTSGSFDDEKAKGSDGAFCLNVAHAVWQRMREEAFRKECIAAQPPSIVHPFAAQAAPQSWPMPGGTDGP